MKCLTIAAFLISTLTITAYAVEAPAEASRPAPALSDEMSAGPIIVDAPIVTAKPVQNAKTAPAPQRETFQVNNETLDIEGYKHDEPQPATDREIEAVKKELAKQQQTIKLNKQKAKTYQVLSQTTEKLIDTTDEMSESKTDSQIAIAEYNKKLEASNKRMECLQQNNYDKKKCP